VRRAVLAWSDALDKHDASALGRLYGDPVRFYGNGLSRSAVLHAKEGALGRDSTFHQTIVGDIEVTPGEGGSATATFLKRSGSRGRLRDVHARLVFQRVDGGAPVIVEETDDVTEHARASAEKRSHDDSSDFEAEAAKVVNDLPEVKRTVAGLMKAADESHGRARFGGFGPNPEAEDGRLVVGIGIHTDERFQGAIWYEVDLTGHLSVTVDGEDVPVRPDALRAVERACSQGGSR
jgi:hypothetical protein